MKAEDVKNVCVVGAVSAMFPVILGVSLRISQCEIMFP
jgi:hypothetical protein